MYPCRYIVSEPASGAMNMALDEALLESAAEDDCTSASLRIYQWARPTLSLGYFQRAADRDGHGASRDCDLIRRPSGGGAILHDRELTYVLVLPEAIAKTRPATQWYLDVHNALIAALCRVGTAHQPSINWNGLSLVGDAHPTDATPFLCFQRRSKGDVLFGKHKIAGSAQRRRRGAILQHGSVLLRSSRFAPELQGVADVMEGEFAWDDLADAFTRAMSRLLGFDFRASEVTDGERRAASHFKETKYIAEAWTLRR